MNRLGENPDAFPLRGVSENYLDIALWHFEIVRKYGTNFVIRFALFGCRGHFDPNRGVRRYRNFAGLGSRDHFKVQDQESVADELAAQRIEKICASRNQNGLPFDANLL